MNPRTPASRWRRLLKLKRKKNSITIVIGFFFTPPQFLATKVTISFVYYSPKTIKCTQKPKIEKSLQESTNRASERASAILHIISTTCSWECAQFTSLKKKGYKSLKSKKRFTGNDQSSDRVPFSTPYLQLTLARNSRVKKGKEAWN